MISYGLYLWHWLFLAWASTKGWLLELPVSFFWLCLITLVGTTLAATASWDLVEKPLMRRARSVKAFRHRREGRLDVAVESSS